MDPRLRKLGAWCIADVDRHHRNLPNGDFQVGISKFIRVSDAPPIFERMREGVPGPNAIQLFNPELVVRKMEARQGILAAINKVNRKIAKVNRRILRSTTKINQLKDRLALGPDNVRVGPSINHRAVPHHQVIFPSECEIEEDKDGGQATRRMSKKRKLKSRADDATSQIAFWELNLTAIEAKAAALISYRDALISSREEFARSALNLPTLIGSGFSDYTFAY